MKITDNNSSLNIRKYVSNIKDNRKIDGFAKQGSSQTVKEDKVVSSPKAKDVQEATKLIKELPDIRKEKVAKLKEQVDQGTYRIDGKRIAFKMLKESILDELL
jgi:negative regulator of flagellin synthesis FlgM